MTTGIEWTDETWNPVTGCTKVSPGCKNCYAERMAGRLQAMGQDNYRNGFAVTLQSHALHIPLRWRKPRRVFVCSMADLFHEKVPSLYIDRVVATMAHPKAVRHTFQVLTKRPARMMAYMGTRHPQWQWPDHAWVGVSVESSEYRWRIEMLREINQPKVKFLSLEPLLGPLFDLDLTGTHWVIVGGESGPGARPCDIAWVEDIVRQCKAAGVAVFVKQLGSRHPDHKKFDRWPVSIRVREFPE